MIIPPEEVIDRWSIVKLKCERIGGANLDKELSEYQQAINELKKQAIKIDDSWLEELYNINKAQWDLESEMRQCQEKGDLVGMGKVYIEIQKSNKRRVAVKSKIIESTGLGFKDIKMN